MKRQQSISRIKKEYGVDPRDLGSLKESRDMIEKVNIYHNLVKDKQERAIDPITWNDLEMDEVFYRVNHTRSYAGEQVLYHILHGNTVDERNKLDKEARFFDENEEDRIYVERGLIRVGKRYIDYYVPDTLDTFQDIRIKHAFIYPLLLCLLIFSIILAIFKPQFGGLIVMVATINIIVYAVVKLKYENELEALASIRGIIQFGEFLMKSEKLASRYESEGIKKNIKELSKLTEVINFYTARKNMQNSGEPMSVIGSYILGVTLIDVICCSMVINKLKSRNADLMKLYEFIGWLDAAISVASFRNSLDSCQPEIRSDGYIECKAVYHPLLNNPVKNDLIMKKNCFFTGANATGKSTFMKALAINVILGETINTCAADSMAFPEMYVMTSMALRDDVQEGESYYVREIKYLKRMLETTDSGIRTLIVIDEILKGTNTKERIAASRSVLEYLSERNAIVITATHDMELVEFMEDLYDSYHFDCQIEDGEVKFDYKLLEGKNVKTNAIQLMKGMGFPDSITERGEEYAAAWS